MFDFITIKAHFANVTCPHCGSDNIRPDLQARMGPANAGKAMLMPTCECCKNTWVVTDKNEKPVMVPASQDMLQFFNRYAKIRAEIIEPTAQDIALIALFKGS